ncbi:hypothetical protein A2954_00290 [Candidatus Roizmanbacteria bacterium RIFCSPLOWO2_01_FULL_37_12]|uniref:TNase-like domain-containing protein n=1 Tax=Candidatus Roizmanbacteria bacterium RIFCSPLOWO2_01_FULL_37_12 TaxID=1802056 RepID=A0A1F7IB67_9BACT|nr:MAG: hypothetical protein A2768_00495 [Candidatus Roizmanbacteria bacterium RIFCSPHIGHO2_01_FULL_37_16]OGK25915.1 MAG: hypothetical protein A3D76_06775 [Candidatus Roizmanbacteria bacterium RIFCSPHIGHO2_02_FULL_37_9b]OGK40603.1 MAG: hypothetical protein A2954_00290 [Candidatus Roizmanbacteria bacterium RIFCSPLOWO2_01_FULL_37_12]
MTARKATKFNRYKLILFVITAISLILNLVLILKNSNFKLIPTNSKFNRTITARILRVIDGDSFVIAGGERIRLAFIDAPENPKGCLGEDAKVRLENLIADKTVSLELFSKDNFGRILALVYLDKLFINEVLVEEGFAYFRTDKKLHSISLIIEKAEERAKLAGRGVWSNLCQTKQEGCIIKGNYRSADNSRIYHTPDCYNYNRITIKPGTTERWFCSEEEALAAGFKISLDCPKH